LGWQRRFWAIFIGQAFSLVGSALTQFVLLWWITDTTGDVTSLTKAGMAALLPQALLAPLGGTLADRTSRRALIVGADAMSALCMMALIALFLARQVELWHLYTIMGLRSALQAFQVPASAASTSLLVPYTFLPRAAGLHQTVQGVMTVMAAPLGALVINLMPLEVALSIDVLTAGMGIVPLLIFRIPQARSSKETSRSLWIEFREGVHLVWHHGGLRRLYALLGAVVLVITPPFILLPLMVKQHFGGSAQEVALMEGLYGVGMIVGGLASTSLTSRLRVPSILLGFAISCLFLALTALAPRHLFGWGVTAWILSGLTFITGNVPFTALLQSTIPNHLQGRALALLNTVTGLAAPIGLALSTLLGEWLGVRWLFVVQGALGALLCLTGFLSPALRHFEVPPEK
jgi:MFS transporter, DHA3 family, macrolide efflux protein